MRLELPSNLFLLNRQKCNTRKRESSETGGLRVRQHEFGVRKGSFSKRGSVLNLMCACMHVCICVTCAGTLPCAKIISSRKTAFSVCLLSLASLSPWLQRVFVCVMFERELMFIQEGV